MKKAFLFLCAFFMLPGITRTAFTSYHRLATERYLLATGKRIVSSKSFMYTRPVFQNSAARFSFWHSAFFDTSKSMAFRATPIYQQTFKPENFLPYFLMKYKTSINISNNVLTGDVRPEWLGLPAAFEGTFNIRPEQKQFGLDLAFRKTFPKLFDLSFFDGWWLYATMPIVMIKNDLHFTQSNVTNPGPATDPVHDVITAFQNPDWNYLKIKNRAETKTRVGQIQIGLGKTFICEDFAHLTTYSGLSIPTYHSANNKYLFEEQPGFNGHVGFVWGFSTGFPLTRAGKHCTTSFFLNFESIYLLRNHQYRTLDLIDKQWSRYMLFRQQGLPAEPGVNVLTQRVRCSPYNYMDAATGFRFDIQSVEAEIGFGVWGHSDERIMLVNEWNPIYGIAGTTLNTSASQSTIKTLAADDFTFTPIQHNQLDLDTPAQPGTLVWRGHLALGSRQRGETGDAFFGLGVFVEVPRNETKYFSQWGAWFTFGGAL